MLRAKMLKNAWVGAFSLKLGREEKVMSQRCSFFRSAHGAYSHSMVCGHGLGC